MKKIIVNKLKEIEQSENIRILHAVESGSRAWGFESPDSDYDVRFIYVRPKEFYLRLDKTRDVIELPINDELDISGWDLNKSLVLLHKSNPTLFEWFSSPIQYITTDFADGIQPYLKKHFNGVKSLYHYLSMAKTNYRAYLKDGLVKAKKYFYVLRPILACEWIIDKDTAPPMLFSDLMKAELPENLCEPVNELLNIKMNSPEVKEIPKVQVINDYVESEIASIAEMLTTLKDVPVRDWDDLNRVFLTELEKSW